MRSSHSISLCDPNSPSFIDDFEFFTTMLDRTFKKIFESNYMILSDGSDIPLSIDKIKSMMDIADLVIQDNDDYFKIEINYSQYPNKSYSIEIYVPDKFNIKQITVSGVSLEIMSSIMIKYFPKLKLPKKAKNNVK